MNKKLIDLSDIKENDLDKTSSFTDLMTRSERSKRNSEKIIQSNDNDIEEMVSERKRSTKDLTLDLEKAKKQYQKQSSLQDEEELSNTQIIEITRQMKFNFEEVRKENTEKKKNSVSILNIIGISNLLCIGYYIYSLIFTNYQSELNYMITGVIIVLLVLLFGISVVTSKKVSKFFNILNILTILVFIFINILTIFNKI